jgi:hypothetical protein
MQAVGESFADCVCPPVPCGNMFVADCWDIVCEQLVDEVTPSRLAALTRSDLERVRKAFGSYFECNPPSLAQVKAAVKVSLARWPVGSLGESADLDVAPDRGGTKASHGSRSPRRRGK